ncbi:MAG: SlyX family protein [Pseudomonadota bacterium]|nr:SlyX family protein [Pseudomonadota bacterium]
MTEERFIDLETRLTYQEDAIQELNKVVAEQQRRIDQLEAASQLLGARIRGLSEELPAAGQGDEKPPHY